AIYGQMTARENLLFFGELYGLSGRKLRDRADAVLAAVALEHRANRRADTFSGGMKRRLNLGCALVHRPQLLLLDEPTVGVDPQSRNHIFEEIKRLNTAGVTVVYTSHYMEEVQALCPRMAIMDHGRVIACDKVTTLLGSLPGKLRFRVDAAANGVLDRFGGLPGVEGGGRGTEPCSPVGGSPTLPNGMPCLSGPVFTVRTVSAAADSTVNPVDGVCCSRHCPLELTGPVLRLAKVPSAAAHAARPFH